MRKSGDVLGKGSRNSGIHHRRQYILLMLDTRAAVASYDGGVDVDTGAEA
jgi:hypothetical protein